MPRDSKVYFVRLLFWATAIFVIARPLRTVRAEIGDAAWPLGYRERGAKDRWDIDVDD
jgi:hypothetical protein